MKIKRILCAALCVCVILAAAVIPAGAKSCDCGQVIHIHTSGFGSALYYNYGTPEQEKAGIARTDDLAHGIGQVFRGAGLSVWERSWDPLAAGLGEAAWGVLGHNALDANGRSIAPITSHWRINPEQNHRENPEYNFNYDYRLDPFELADQLNAFIETLCKKTGHSKVALTGASEGSVVGLTYIKQYGTKRLDTFIILNGAWQGLTLVGELFTGKFQLSGPAITNFIANNDDGSGHLRRGMKLLEWTHLLDFTKPLGKGVLRTMGDRIYEDTLIPLYGLMPVIWAFVPHEYYPEARKLIAGNPEYAQLLAKADRYQNQVQARAGKLLKKARADGVKIAVIASYGKHPFPFTQNCTFQSDGMIDTAYEAGGATAAPIGKTLPPSDSKYRSHDGIFDAATCMFPDQTWFIKNSGHEDRPSHELRQWIIHSKKQPTVWDSPEWPQWLVKNSEGKAAPYTG